MVVDRVRTTNGWEGQTAVGTVEVVVIKVLNHALTAVSHVLTVARRSGDGTGDELAATADELPSGAIAVLGLVHLDGGGSETGTVRRLGLATSIVGRAVSVHVD